MKNPTKNSLKEAISRWAADQRTEFSEQPPSDDVLRAYFSDELDPEGRAQVERFLVFDEATASSALALATEPVEQREYTVANSAEPSESETAALWQRIVAEVEAEGSYGALELPDLPKSSKSVTEANRPGFKRRTLLLAAGWLLTVVGLGIWISQLLHRLEVHEEATQTTSLASVSENSPAGTLSPLLSIAPTTLRLVPQEKRERSTSPIPRIDSPPKRGEVRLLMESTDFRPFENYRAELLSADGSLLAELSGFQRVPGGHFILSLHPRRLNPGAYALRIVGRIDHESHVIGFYPFDWKPSVGNTIPDP